MTDLPVVCVITIVRNDRAGLERTVRSVASQSYAPIEHLVIDGASTDGTAEWLASNSGDIRGRFISEPDDGIYDAMNKGIERATGDLVVFLNAGDSFPDDKTVALVADNWAAHRWVWAYGAVRWVRDGRPVKVVRQEPYSLRDFAQGRLWVPHQSTYVRTDALKRLGGFREHFGVGADQELLLRLAKSSDPHVISHVLSNFELGGAHSQLSIWQREFAWRRMRKANFGAGAWDLLRTATRASFLTVRHRIGKRVRAGLAMFRGPSEA